MAGPGFLQAGEAAEVPVAVAARGLRPRRFDALGARRRALLSRRTESGSSTVMRAYDLGCLPTFSVSGNAVRRACFRILVLICDVWSAGADVHMPLSRAVVTRLVPHLDPRVIRRSPVIRRIPVEHLLANTCSYGYGSAGRDGIVCRRHVGMLSWCRAVAAMAGSETGPEGRC